MLIINNEIKLPAQMVDRFRRNIKIAIVPNPLRAALISGGLRVIELPMAKAR